MLQFATSVLGNLNVCEQNLYSLTCNYIRDLSLINSEWSRSTQNSSGLIESFLVVIFDNHAQLPEGVDKVNCISANSTSTQHIDQVHWIDNHRETLRRNSIRRVNHFYGQSAYRFLLVFLLVSTSPFFRSINSCRYYNKSTYTQQAAELTRKRYLRKMVLPKADFIQIAMS